MRQFLAARLPGRLDSGVAALQRRIGAELRGWRWVRPEGIHLTLRFLGDVDDSRDARARAVWREVIAGCAPFGLRLTDLGRFPPRGRPRVLWVGVEETDPGGALATLAERLESAARELGFDPESRPFRPHLTLARGGRPGIPSDPAALGIRGSAEGRVREVVLYRSDLLPTGARYTALEAYPLHESGRE
jgi:2'-5' RNA ligase